LVDPDSYVLVAVFDPDDVPALAAKLADSGRDVEILAIAFKQGVDHRDGYLDPNFLLFARQLLDANQDDAAFTDNSDMLIFLRVIDPHKLGVTGVSKLRPQTAQVGYGNAVILHL
jgi:hypothetical protein